jgi:hypothetical protein
MELKFGLGLYSKYLVVDCGGDDNYQNLSAMYIPIFIFQ